MIEKAWLAARLWLAALLPPAGAPPTPVAPPPARIDAGAAWSPSAAATADLRDSCADKPEDEAGGCILSAMQRAGASTAAVDLARRLGGREYLRAFDDRGRVGVARMRDPLRGVDGILLVNGDPPIVDPTSAALVDPLQTDARLTSLRPNAALWTEAIEPPGLKTLPNGGQRYVFLFPVRTCDRCPDLAQGLVGYDFDADGRFLGAKLLNVRHSALFTASGEVVQGKAFEASLGENLILRLEPFPEGWTIAVRDKAGRDYGALATPPFEGANDLAIYGWQLRRSGSPGKVRRFRCVRSPEQYEQALKDVDATLWRLGPSPRDVSAARRDYPRVLDAARPGRLTITDFKLGPKVDGKGPSILSMKFDFELSPAPDEK